MPDWTTNKDLIQKLYIAFYGRPADPGGLRHWAQQLPDGSKLTDAATKTLIDTFIRSDEAKARIGNADDSAMHDSIVDKIYTQAFHRDATAAEKAQFASTSISDVLVQVLGVSSGPDFAALNNKLDYANWFVETLDPNGNGIADDDSTGTKFMATFVGNTDATDIAAKMLPVDSDTYPTQAAVVNDVKAIAEPDDPISKGEGGATGQTFTLTTGTDYADTTTAFLNGGALPTDFKFTAGNETVNAAAGTLQTADILIDGSTTDSDVLSATLSAAALQSPTITNIETLKLSISGNGAGLDMANVTGAKTVEISGTQNGVLSNVEAAAPDVALTGGYNKTLTVAFDTLAGTATASPESLKVNLVDAGASAVVNINIEGTTNTGSLEQLTVNSAGTAANTLTVGTADFDGTAATAYAAADGISKFVVTGTEDLTLKVEHATISTKELKTDSFTGELTLDVDRGTLTTQVTSLAQTSGYETLVLRGTGDVNVSGIPNAATVKLVDSFTGTGSDSLAVKGAATGTSDSMTLVLDHKTDATDITFNAPFLVNDIETVSIQSLGGTSTGHTLGDTATTGGFEANAAKTINLLGDTTLTLNLDTDTKFETLNIEGAAKYGIDYVGTGAVNYASGHNVAVNAGTATGDLTLDLSQIQLDTGTSTTETLSVTTGTGKDALTFAGTFAGAKLVVDAGDGDNTIVVMGDGAATANISGDVSITTGTGKDTVVFGPNSTYTAATGFESSSAKVTIATGAGDDVVKLGNVTKTGSTIDLGDGDDTLWVGVDATTTGGNIVNDLYITTGSGKDTIKLFSPNSMTDTAPSDQKVVISDFTAGTSGDKLNLQGWAGTGFATAFAAANTAGQAALTGDTGEKGLFKLGAFDAANIANGATADAFSIGDNDKAVAVLFNNNTGLSEVWTAYDSATGDGATVVVEKICTLENITLTGIQDLKIDNFDFSA